MAGTVDASSSSELCVKVSAPGKVILHGEHSVVYGKLALACSVGKRTFVTVKQVAPREQNLNTIKLDFHTLNETVFLSADKLNRELSSREALKCDDLPAIDEILNAIVVDSLHLSDSARNATKAFLFLYDDLFYRQKYRTQRSGDLDCFHGALDVRVESQIRTSSGLGSSASFNVAMAAALFLVATTNEQQSRGKENFSQAELSEVNRLAFECERIMHGNPSGVDNTVCTYGSFVAYRRHERPQPLQLSRTKLRALLIDSGVPKDTKKMVAKVAELFARLPTVVTPTLEALEGVAQQAVHLLRLLDERMTDDCRGNAVDELYEEILELVEINQNLLRVLGVSHPQIERACFDLRSAGLTAKITGAGGGGYVLCLVPPHYSESSLESVRNKLTDNGFECSVFELGSPGVCIC